MLTNTEQEFKQLKPNEKAERSASIVASEKALFSFKLSETELQQVIMKKKSSRSPMKINEEIEESNTSIDHVRPLGSPMPRVRNMSLLKVGSEESNRTRLRKPSLGAQKTSMLGQIGGSTRKSYQGLKVATHSSVPQMKSLGSSLILYKFKKMKE